MSFKFQSDSINTDPDGYSDDYIITLNSNLILLIPLICFSILSIASVTFKFQSDSINTNWRLHILQLPVHFKFQSDSINTLYEKKIPYASVYFKFQSDSINTKSTIEKILCEKYFKFQSDSINTELSAVVLRKSFITLNSNLILLILEDCEDSE